MAAELDNPVLTPERLKAAQAAAREKLLRKRARAAGKPVAAAAPPPPRPPTIHERMRGGGIVPLDELLALRDEIVVAAAQERKQIAARSQRELEAYEASRAAFAQQKPAFDELCTIQAQLAEALGRRHREVGETQRLLEEQIGLRCRSIAEAIHESQRFVDEASRVVAAAKAGQHFGNLSHVLEAAVRFGFWERIDEKGYQKMRDRDKRRAIFNRGTCYFPADRTSVLQELVNEHIRDLYRRAIDAAEAERPAQLAMLESGPFPSPYELFDLVDPEKSLPADRQFGCVLVQLAVSRSSGQGMMLVSGVIQLAFVNVDGVGKCIAVLEVNGSASKALKPETIPLASLAEHPAVNAVVQHLSDIADEALFTDEQAAQINEARTARAKTERRQPWLVPATEVERQFRFLELAGELWHDRNSKWIARHRAQAAGQQPIAPKGSEPAAISTSKAATDAPAPAEQPKGPRKPRGSRRAKAGGNGVHEGAQAAPAPDAAAGAAPTGDTPAS